ncbi:Transmembrane protein 45B [Cichlidogyrus casuarinus]|uniref:Transmembrane protein 45B n=1 Tax=Cichlidogyrus casuarinus TaxID=1844966 RepID=A0ABD2Q294_9PLAT
MALAVESFLFMFHLHGRTTFDIYLHLVLVAVVWLNIIAGILEMVYEKEVSYAILRCFFLVIQGTWFCHVGAILYPPSTILPQYKDDESELNISRASQILSWHFFINGVIFLIIMLSISAICSKTHPETNHSNLKYDSEPFVINEEEDEEDELIVCDLARLETAKNN